MLAALVNDTSTTGHPGCIAVVSSLITTYSEHGIDIVLRFPIGMSPELITAELEKHPTIELIVVNGEGTIHHTKSNKRAESLCHIARLAKERLSLESILVNATLFKIHEKAFELLRDFKAISVRETQSRELLQARSIASHVIPDASFFYADSSTHQRAATKFLFTDSVKKCDSKRLEELATSLRCPFTPMIIRKRPKIWRKAINRIRPPRLHPINSQDVDTVHLDTFLDTISSAQTIITGRFHSTTLALSLGRGVLCLNSNTPKIASVLTDIFSSRDRILGRHIFLQPEELATHPKRKLSPSEWLKVKSYIQHGRSSLSSFLESVCNSAYQASPPP